MDHIGLKQQWVEGDHPASERANISEEAFQEAVATFAADLRLNSEKISFASEAASLNDVVDTVRQAQSQYQFSKSTKARKWLNRFSGCVVFYSTVFDVLVQQHPEYVSLAWGAMKFLFISVANHENAIASLSKGLTQIAEALPRVELATLLYPTERMKDATKALYAYFLRFLMRAHGWYKEGRFLHVIHSITRPAELRYKDLLENILECSRNIHQLAVAGSQVELRDMHKKLHIIETSVEEMKEKMICGFQNVETGMMDATARMVSLHSLNSSAHLDTAQRLTDLQFSQMMAFVSDETMLDPGQSFQHGLFIRNKRRKQGIVEVSSKFWFSPELQRFSSSPISDLIIVKGTFQSRQAVRDVAVTITEELRRKNAAVLWAVKIDAGLDQTRQPSSKDILKSLVAQAMRVSQGIQTDKSMSINCTRMRTADSEMDWIQLLALVLAALNQTVYLALDLAMFRDGILLDVDITQVISMFTSLIGELNARGLKTKVKIMLFSYKAASGLAMSSHNVVTVRGDTRPWLRSNRREQQWKRGSSAVRTSPYRSRKGMQG